MRDDYFKLSNAPDDQPLAFDLGAGKVYFDTPSGGDESNMDLDSPHSIANMSNTANHARPDWLKQFYGQMGSYVKDASDKAAIDEDSGELRLGVKMTASDLKKVCGNLAWLYEAQYRQNKEILLWIGEIILDYIARAPHDITIEEAIEGLGLLDRSNGVKWKLRTLARWPIVVQRIPAQIRQLPIPPTYLSEAALFAQPEDPAKKIAFSNARDSLLLAVADKPDSWSRARFVNCMKELQEAFGIERMRNEGVAALQARLLSLYRIRELSHNRGSTSEYYKSLGLSLTDVCNWIYNIESELIHRGKMEALPEDDIPSSDGLTKNARERIAKGMKRDKDAERPYKHNQ